MRVLAWALTAWSALRWLGLLAGLVRLRRFEGPVRREARRSCVARFGWNVLWSAAAFFVWVQALGLRPRAETTGFVGTLLVLSLAAGVAAAFMQPEERTPETLGIFRLRRAERPESEDRPAG